jgi:ABC-type glycerol-3-phosphate transport system permease component
MNATLNNFAEIVKVSGVSKIPIPGSDEVWKVPRLYVWFLNTTFITLFSTAVHLLFDSMAGYAFAKRKFPGSNVLFVTILAALMIPPQVTLVPLYLMITQWKLVNTYAGVILPGLADVIGIFLLKQYIQTLPGELEEAARMDGASEWTIYTKIILPLTTPALAVTAIFSFQRYWNTFIWPLIVLQNPDMFTLQVGLAYVRTSEFGTNYGLLLAGAALAAIPMIIFFFAFQRHFMQGLRIGAIKGYQVELVVPSNISEERRKALNAYGARMIFTDPLLGSDGALLEAKRIYESDPHRYFKGDQYNNPSNWEAHYETTGVEILQQSRGKVTHFIAGVGTGGTLMGIGRRLKEFNPEIRLFGVQPDNGFHGIEGLKHIETAIRPAIYDESILDGTFFVKTEDAYEMAIRLAREEGLWVGLSSGAAFWASLRLAESIDRGTIVTIFPDGVGKGLCSGSSICSLNAT